MSDWHVWLFYGTTAFISVYSVITWKQIMWLYTLTSPYGVDDNDVAIRMFSWSALRQLAASTFSIPAFILLGQKCISSIPTEFVTIPFTLVIATVIYTLGCSYSAPEKAFYRLKKYGYLAEDATGNEGWIEFTIRHFMQYTYGMVLSLIGIIAVSIFLLYIVLF